jgi:hypothetical protein
MRKLIAICILLALSTTFGFFRWFNWVEVKAGLSGNYLTFGADSSATDGFDIGLDIPFFPIPGAYGYFPISDSAHPAYTMLGTDYRAPSQDTMAWDIMLAGGFGFVLYWNSSAIHEAGEYHIGAFNLDSLPNFVVDDWQDMRETDSIAINFFGGRIRVVGAPISPINEVVLSPNTYKIGISPNPFNSSCRIEIEYGEAKLKSVEIFDLAGRKVSVLSTTSDNFESITGQDSHKTNANRFTWQPAQEIPAGMFFVHAHFENEISAQKRILYLK